MKITMISALSIATVAALPLAAVANACGGGSGGIPADQGFATPSGNIVCSIHGDGSGANCEVREHTWAIPASTVGPYGRSCDLDFGGLQFYVSQREPGMLGCYEGATNFDSPDRKTLDYGQSHSHGHITCDSQMSGVTCTDTATGHFFLVSREKYDLG